MTESLRRSPGLSALLRPASVAVLGASARKLSAGNHVLLNLRRQSYAGDIHVVHPSAASIDGLTAVPEVAPSRRGAPVGQRRTYPSPPTRPMAA
ncbi:CoA-binding protein [Streptomyces sp. NPDC059441]|uniref:CoA-binding protein n=1 Tax=Streptomyces sp. NPDC059441 TaxID=3346829 RepID=UPI0036C4006B